MYNKIRALVNMKRNNLRLLTLKEVEELLKGRNIIKLEIEGNIMRAIIVDEKRRQYIAYLNDRVFEIVKVER
jgi:hypothetical protein